MSFVANERQYKWLNALYSGIITLKKNPDDEKLRVGMRKKFEDYAEILDKLGVPWHVQNAVAAAGEERGNWERYNSIVLSEVFGKCRSAQNNNIKHC